MNFLLASNDPNVGGGGQGLPIINFNGLRNAYPSDSLPGRGTNIGEIFSKALNFVFVIAGLLLLFYLISGGFQMMLGANDPKTKEGASKTITNALVGFIFIFVSYWLIQIIEIIFNIAILK